MQGMNTSPMEIAQRIAQALGVAGPPAPDPQQGGVPSGVGQGQAVGAGADSDLEELRVRELLGYPISAADQRRLRSEYGQWRPSQRPLSEELQARARELVEQRGLTPQQALEYATSGGFTTNRSLPNASGGSTTPSPINQGAQYGPTNAAQSWEEDTPEAPYYSRTDTGTPGNAGTTLGPPDVNSQLEQNLITRYQRVGLHALTQQEQERILNMPAFSTPVPSMPGYVIRSNDPDQVPFHVQTPATTPTRRGTASVPAGGGTLLIDPDASPEENMANGQFIAGREPPSESWTVHQNADGSSYEVNRITGEIRQVGNAPRDPLTVSNGYIVRRDAQGRPLVDALPEAPQYYNDARGNRIKVTTNPEDGTPRWEYVGPQEEATLRNSGIEVANGTAYRLGPNGEVLQQRLGHPDTFTAPDGSLHTWEQDEDKNWVSRKIADAPQKDLRFERNPETGALEGYDPRTGQLVSSSGGKQQRHAPIPGPGGILFDWDEYQRSGQLVPMYEPRKEVQETRSGGLLIPGGMKVNVLRRNEGTGENSWSHGAYRVDQYGDGGNSTIARGSAPQLSQYLQQGGQGYDEAYIPPGMYNEYYRGLQNGGWQPSQPRQDYGGDTYGGYDSQGYGDWGEGQDVGWGQAAPIKKKKLPASGLPLLPYDDPFAMANLKNRMDLGGGTPPHMLPGQLQMQGQVTGMGQDLPTREDNGESDSISGPYNALVGWGADDAGGTGGPLDAYDDPRFIEWGRNRSDEAAQNDWPSHLFQAYEGGPWIVVPRGTQEQDRNLLRPGHGIDLDTATPPRGDAPVEVEVGTDMRGFEMTPRLDWSSPSTYNDAMDMRDSPLNWEQSGHEHPPWDLHGHPTELRGRTGWGSDRGEDSLQGWVNPIDPQNVVGIGHRWMEPVDMEGTHKGLDEQAFAKTPVRAPVNGTTSVEWDPRGLGLQVSVQGEDGTQHKMSHLMDTTVQEGQQVGAGEQIARVGSTGAGSTGPHLDLRVIGADGQYHDPSPLVGSLINLPRADKPTGVGSAEAPGWDFLGGDEYDDNNWVENPNDPYLNQDQGNGNQDFGNQDPGNQDQGGGGFQPQYDQWGGYYDQYGDYIAGQDYNQANPFGNQNGDQTGDQNPSGGVDYGTGPGSYGNPIITPNQSNMPINPATGQPYAANTYPYGARNNPPPRPGPTTDTGPLGNQGGTNSNFPGYPSGGSIYGNAGSTGARAGESPSSYRPTTGSSSTGMDPQEYALRQQELSQAQANAERNYQLNLQRLDFDKATHGDSVDLDNRRLQLDTDWHTQQSQFQYDQLNLLADQHTNDRTFDNSLNLARLDIDQKDSATRHDDALARLDLDRQTHGDTVDLQNRQQQLDIQFHTDQLGYQNRSLDLTQAQNEQANGIAQARLQADLETHRDDTLYRSQDMALRSQMAANQNAIDQARLGLTQQQMALDAMTAASNASYQQGQLGVAQGQLAETGSYHQATVALQQAQQASTDAWNQVQAQIAQSRLALDQGISVADIAYKNAQTEVSQGTLALNRQGQQNQVSQFGETMQFNRDTLQAQLDKNQKDYQLGVAKLQQDLSIHGDEDKFNRDKMALDQQFHDQDNALQTQLKTMDIASNKEIQGTFQQKQDAADRASALKNPWLQQLTGMAPGWNTPGGPGTGLTGSQGVPGANGATQGWNPQGMQAQTSGASGGSTANNAGWTPPSYEAWSKESPFERAADRTKAELQGPGVWENQQQQMRNAWGNSGGPMQAPDTTRMTAATQTGTDKIGTEQMAQTFGQDPNQYWQDQSKGWNKAAASQVTQAA